MKKESSIILCIPYMYTEIKRSESIKLNDYLLVDDIDCYIYPPTNEGKVYNWGREEVKFDFRVISWALNESGSFCATEIIIPRVLTTGDETALEGAAPVESRTKFGAVTCAETEGEQARTIAH